MKELFNMPLSHALTLSCMLRHLLLLCLLVSGINYAQGQKVNPLPEFILIPDAPDSYEWKRVLTERDRLIFNNAIAVSDSSLYAFGGFNTERVLRSMLRVDGGRLIADTAIRYPGPGFMNNLFFAQDSALYIGGGLDSGAARYAFQDFHRYDLRTRTWNRLHDLPFYYQKPLHVFTSGDRLLVLAMALYGPGLEQAKPVCYEYRPEEDAWRIRSAELPVDTFTGAQPAASSWGLRAAAFQLGSALYILFQPWETAASTFFKLDPESGAWTKLEPFPDAGQSFSWSFAFSDEAYGYVGGGRARIRSDNSREVFRYDPERNKWERIAPLPRGLRHARGWRFLGESYVGFGISDKYGTVTIWKLRRKR